MKRIRHSIATEMAMIFLGLFGLVLAANLLINNIFLVQYYVHTYEKTLVRIYTLVDDHVQTNWVDADYFRTEISELCNSNNMSIVILDQNYKYLVGSADSNTKVMAARLWGYTNGIEDKTDDSNLLKTTDSYSIQKKHDDAVEMTFLEMWGTLHSGGYFMFRIPMSSIQESAKISNEFVKYFCILALLVCAVSILLVSRKIAKPIRELTDLSERMTALDFNARYTSGGKNEIGKLGENFNAMSETLLKTITELKAANNELQRDNERKTKVDQMRTEFIANVSHELKTPLALIQGYAEGLKECVNDDEESRDFYCDVVMDEAAKMNNMVRKLLTLNQLEFGNDEVTMERFDIVPLIQGKLQSLKILAEQKEAEILYNGPGQIYVWGDEFKVEEVLTNYLSNALNHIDGAKKVTVSADEDGTLVRFTVFNTGQQIPECEMPRLWEKFYKVDKARTREYGGSGVGLSIVKAIMESMNRKYGVENRENGVAFWFELENAQAQSSFAKQHVSQE